MAKITIRKSDGETLEISDIQLSLQEIKELAGFNGHVSSAGRRTRKQAVSVRINDARPDYAGFKKALSESGKKFIDVLRQYPNGILSDAFAEKMGLNNAVQIGGITGGGMAKVAPRFHVDLINVYTVEKKFENGTRTTTYKPGRDLALVQ